MKQTDFHDSLDQGQEETQREIAHCFDCETIRKKFGKDRCPKHEENANLKKALKEVEFFFDEFYVEKDRG